MGDMPAALRPCRSSSLTVQEAHDLLNQEAVDEQVMQETQQNGGGVGGSRTKIQCCGVCGGPDHNARTCKEAAELPDSSVSDSLLLFHSVVVVY